MTIRTWGEFEKAITDTISDIIKRELLTTLGEEPQRPRKPNEPMTREGKYRYDNDLAQWGNRKMYYSQRAAEVERSILQTFLPAIDKYYQDMQSGALGEPNNRNLTKMIQLFSQHMNNTYIRKHLYYLASGDNPQTQFNNIIMRKIGDRQRELIGHQNTIENIACFRFAADGRLNDSEYWDLDNLGNLASKCENFELKKFNPYNIRSAIMGELSCHASRQCGQEMDDAHTVYLCGGYGHGGNDRQSRADIGERQILPEHMWLEIHSRGKPTISIDTFPSRQGVNIGGRARFNFAGPPSEPDRIHTDQKTWKQRIPGLPLGVMSALAEGRSSIIENFPPPVRNQRGERIFIKADGQVLSGQQAAVQFDRLGLDRLINEWNKQIPSDYITRSKTITEASAHLATALQMLAQLQTRGTQLPRHSKNEFDRFIKDKENEFISNFEEKQKLGHLVEQIKIASEKYLVGSAKHSRNLFQSSLFSRESSNRDRANEILTMIRSDRPLFEILQKTREVLRRSNSNEDSYSHYLHEELKKIDPKLVGIEDNTNAFRNLKDRFRTEVQNGLTRLTDEEESRVQNSRT